MTDSKNQQTPITVQPFDQQSLNSSSKKAQRDSAGGRASGRDQAPEPRAAESPDMGAQPTQQMPSVGKQPSSESPAADYANPRVSQAPPPDPASLHTFQGYSYPVPPAPMPADAEGSYPGAYGYDPSPDGDPALSGTGRRKSNILLVGIIACIIAIVILILALLVIEFKPFGWFSDDFTAEPPSELQVQKEFENATLPKPDLEVFRYVDTDGVEMTNLGEYDTGTVQYAGTGNERVATCEVSASATYENDNILIIEPLYMTMTYDKGNGSWTGSNPRTGTIEAAPLSEPDPSLIADNIFNILKSYDASLADMYADAEVTEESTLGNNGGTIVFTLTKTPETPEGGTSAEPLTCTVNSEITWNDSLGWVVKITTVDGDIGDGGTGSEQEAPADPAPAPETPSNNNNNNPSASNNNGSGSGNGSGSHSGPNNDVTTITTETEVQILQLVCSTGDLVEIPGTLRFDSGRILLKTDDEIRVILNGTTYTTNYFEIQGSGSWTNGQHVVVIGTVSATGTLAQAPLVLSV